MTQPRLSSKRQNYDRWYKTARWQKLREIQLATQPTCLMCEAEGRYVIATVCDHVTPHKGDEIAFWSGPFQSLCATHHNSDKQRIEKGGKPKPTIGLDGWPTS